MKEREKKYEREREKRKSFSFLYPPLQLTFLRLSLAFPFSFSFFTLSSFSSIVFLRDGKWKRRREERDKTRKVAPAAPLPTHFFLKHLLLFPFLPSPLLLLLRATLRFLTTWCMMSRQEKIESPSKKILEKKALVSGGRKVGEKDGLFPSSPHFFPSSSVSWFLVWEEEWWREENGTSWREYHFQERQLGHLFFLSILIIFLFNFPLLKKIKFHSISP